MRRPVQIIRLIEMRRCEMVVSLHNSCVASLNKLPEETHGAVNHTGSLRLLSLGAGHGQGIVHVALLVQDDLETQRRQLYYTLFPQIITVVSLWIEI